MVKNLCLEVLSYVKSRQDATESLQIENENEYSLIRGSIYPGIHDKGNLGDQDSDLPDEECLDCLLKIGCSLENQNSSSPYIDNVNQNISSDPVLGSESGHVLLNSLSQGPPEPWDNDSSRSMKSEPWGNDCNDSGESDMLDTISSDHDSPILRETPAPTESVAPTPTVGAATIQKRPLLQTRRLVRRLLFEGSYYSRMASNQVFMTVLILMSLRIELSVAQALENVVAGVGANATFLCPHPFVESVEWTVNGTLFDDLQLGNAVTNVNGDFSTLIFSNIPSDYNGTTVQCNNGETVLWNFILILQGLLHAVGDLEIFPGANTVFLNWTAPFTLDISLDHDIMYCVDVVSSTSSARVCEITETEFIYQIPLESICDELNFTVTPNNVVGNGIPESVPYSPCPDPSTTVTVQVESSSGNSTTVKSSSDNLDHSPSVPVNSSANNIVVSAVVPGVTFALAVVANSEILFVVWKYKLCRKLCKASTTVMEQQTETFPEEINSDSQQERVLS